MDKTLSSITTPGQSGPGSYGNVLHNSQKPRFNFIQPIDRILSVATTSGQSGSGNDGNEEVLCIL